MIKIYNYPGITSGIINIPVGKAFVRVTFSKGYIDKKLSRPATFTTEDPVTQAIIENSPLFGSRIFLDRVYGEDAPVADEEAEVIVEQESQDAVEYPEITTYQEAVAKLKEMGVKAMSLRSLSAVKNAARGLNVSFPNLN